MELLDGESLATRIDRVGKLPLGEALRIMRQGASALAAAHARDIVHRDLKPENIFLVKDPEAQDGERTKILDFGICKLGGIEMTDAGTTVGTPAYMSPEQCQGAEDVDGRADIYALGCVLFHMLTGRPPFDCDKIDDFLVGHASLLPPRPSSLVPGLPPSVDELIARCLAKRRIDRFQSMTLLQVAIGQIVEELEHLDDDDLAIPMAPTAASGTPQPGAKAYTVVMMRDDTPVERRPRAMPRLITDLPPIPPSCIDVEGINRRSPLRTFVRIVLVFAALVGIAAAVPMLSDDDDDSTAPVTVQVPATVRAPAAESPHPTVSPLETSAESPPPPPGDQPPIEKPVTDDYTAAPAPEPKHETARRSLPKAHDKTAKASKPRPVVDDAFVMPSYPSSPPAPVPPPTPAPTEDLYDTR
jgi:hypothetical protein